MATNKGGASAGGSASAAVVTPTVVSGQPVVPADVQHLVKRKGRPAKKQQQERQAAARKGQRGAKVSMAGLGVRRGREGMGCMLEQQQWLPPPVLLLFLHSLLCLLQSNVFHPILLPLVLQELS